MVEKKSKSVDPNEGLDVFKRSDQLFIKLPTGSDDGFMAKAKLFKIKGRTGEGPCTCLVKFLLPNGDLIIKGQTFDPVEERMGVARYKWLLSKKYFTAGGDKVETKLLEIEAKK